MIDTFTTSTPEGVQELIDCDWVMNIMDIMRRATRFALQPRPPLAADFVMSGMRIKLFVNTK